MILCDVLPRVPVLDGGDGLRRYSVSRPDVPVLGRVVQNLDHLSVGQLGLWVIGTLLGEMNGDLVRSRLVTPCPSRPATDSALTEMPAPFVVKADVGVLWGKWMALLARALHVQPVVFGFGRGFKVVGIHTQGHLAPMVDVLSRFLAMMERPDNAMHVGLALPEAKDAIASVSATRPQPTVAVRPMPRRLIDLRPKSLRDRFAFVQLIASLSGDWLATVGAFPRCRPFALF